MAAKRLPYKHSPEETEGEQPWTIYVPLGSVQPPDKTATKVERREPRPHDANEESQPKWVN